MPLSKKASTRNSRLLPGKDGNGCTRIHAHPDVLTHISPIITHADFSPQFSLGWWESLLRTLTISQDNLLFIILSEPIEFCCRALGRKLGNGISSADFSYNHIINSMHNVSKQYRLT
ncbi:hypothetical protein AG1IA_09019 [Rhizoctonia solani AG-1 IA]|uniref:Uncharacterized protein n=1 Tax=Thanatephorus cucumeris (strain AG1-IA) TaxID=983506 RepID=L8WFK1_THACA|nr:hypothetical protein AG1IA_09019 [Rhizoctonia solani AG-1 IA]